MLTSEQSNKTNNSVSALVLFLRKSSHSGPIIFVANAAGGNTRRARPRLDGLARHGGNRSAQRRPATNFDQPSNYGPSMSGVCAANLTGRMWPADRVATSIRSWFFRGPHTLCSRFSLLVPQNGYAPESGNIGKYRGISTKYRKLSGHKHKKTGHKHKISGHKHKKT